MRTWKHCESCWRALILTEKDLDTKPLKCIELIKIFKETDYKINSNKTYISKSIESKK